MLKNDLLPQSSISTSSSASSTNTKTVSVRRTKRLRRNKNVKRKKFGNYNYQKLNCNNEEEEIDEHYDDAYVNDIFYIICNLFYLFFLMHEYCLLVNRCCQFD